MKKILLVDDLKTILEKEKSILSRADFQIFTANNAKEALEIHKKEQVDLIVSDLDMPGTPGDALCSALRTDGGLKKTAFMMVCTSRKSDLERCLQCGASTYIIKPIDPAEFFEKVSALLNVAERKSFRVLVKIQVEGRHLNIPFFCTSRDISATGMLIETEKALVKGDKLTCSFYLPSGERQIIEAEVARTMAEPDGKFSLGLKFLRFLSGSSAEIDAYIKAHSSAQR